MFIFLLGLIKWSLVLESKISPQNILWILSLLEGQSSKWEVLYCYHF